MRSPPRTLFVLAAAAALVLLDGCAPGPNPLAHHANAEQGPAGFLLGLWHGIIIWLTFFVSLFDQRVSVYEVYNSGWPYNFGFVIGAASLHGGGVGISRRRRRRSRATS